MLTFSALQALKPRDKAYKVTDRQGLFAEVLPSGSIVWRYQYLLSGKRSKVTLGKFRSAGEPKTYVEMSLDDAREKHFDLRKLVKQGLDPASVKRKDKADKRYTNDEVKTLADLFERWLEDKSENTRRAARGYWTKDIAPDLGQRFVNSVTATDVESVVAKVESRGSPASAEKVAMVLRQMYQFGMSPKLGYAAHNPAKEVTLATKRDATSHRRLLPAEIGPFMRALAHAGGREESRLAVRLLALTLLRKDELRLATWGEVDLENAVLRVPADRMKMREEHTVYLSTQAVTILKRLHELANGSAYVFHHQSTRERPIGHTSINSVIDRIEVAGGRFVPHGFRATASSLLNTVGFRGDVIEKLLAHGDRKSIRGIYNQTEYVHERIEALQWLADYYDCLEASDKVIEPHRFKPLKTAA